MLRKIPRIALSLSLLTLSITGSMSLSSCGSDTAATPATGYAATALVADVSGLGATRIDTNLKNPWGLAFAPNAPIWVANNGSGTSTVYDSAGVSTGTVVRLPGSDSVTAGKVTGIVYNPDVNAFTVPGNGVSTFIFAGEDGVISGWNALGRPNAVAMVNRGATSNYKGIATGSNGGNSLLYAANFSFGTVDVFDKNFAFTGGNPDPSMPVGFAPFNVAVLNGKLYVTYAKQNGSDELAGEGLGYVDVFTLDGRFEKRLASGGTLNAPWGMTIAPAGFGDQSGKLLVGNFGDGKINVFNLDDGTYVGQLKDANGTVIVIPGLWSLAARGNSVYYTAGPNDEAHGVLGKISVK